MRMSQTHFEDDVPEHHKPPTIDEIRKMSYAGGGYMRENKPIGQSAKIIHTPALVKILLEEIDRLKGEQE